MYDTEIRGLFYFLSHHFICLERNCHCWQWDLPSGRTEFQKNPYRLGLPARRSRTWRTWPTARSLSPSTHWGWPTTQRRSRSWRWRSWTIWGRARETLDRGQNEVWNLKFVDMESDNVQAFLSGEIDGTRKPFIYLFESLITSLEFDDDEWGRAPLEILVLSATNQGLQEVRLIHCSPWRAFCRTSISKSSKRWYSHPHAQLASQQLQPKQKWR